MEAAWSFNMVVHMCMRGPKRRPKAAKRLARHRPEVTPDERFVRWLLRSVTLSVCAWADGLWTPAPFFRCTLRLRP